MQTDHSGRVPSPPANNTNGRTIHNEPPHAYHFGAHLPKLKIPVFSGEPLNWQDCFQATIDTNPTLTGVQKLSYLRAQL